MNTLSVPAFAKLNLFLKVCRRRSDGFHDIETLFQRIDLCDEVKLTKRSSKAITLSCGKADIPSDARNLAYRAARLLQETCGVKNGVRIDLQKRIPIAAGLAGGSSDAAAVLKGLNQLWGLDLPKNKLVELARALGSDVAFFLYDTAWALGTERGDVITPLKGLPKFWYVVVTPRVRLLAGRIYQGLNLELTKKNVDVNIVIQKLKENKIKNLKSLFINDLETEILRVCPQLSRIKQRFLSWGINGVLVSGSGPSVFGIAQSEQQAKEIAQEFSKRFQQVFVARTL